jgi:hypothetical protein
MSADDRNYRTMRVWNTLEVEFVEFVPKPDCECVSKTHGDVTSNLDIVPVFEASSLGIALSASFSSLGTVLSAAISILGIDFAYL